MLIVVAVRRRRGRPISFLANSNSNIVSWSPDGTFILFDTSQRTEDGSLARIDLKLRTPKFREDQFRDLFKQENPQRQTRADAFAASPAPSSLADDRADRRSVNKPEERRKRRSEKPEIVFEDIRQRLSILPTGVDVNGQIISPDGKTAADSGFGRRSI